MEQKPLAQELPVRGDYGGGCYRRGILLHAEPGALRGELADDFHHFAVRIRHDGDAVLEVRGEDVRVPWTTCPGALEPLRRMQGSRFSASLFELLRHTSPREQCTHLHDLACLAIAHGARAGTGQRRYDIAVPDRVDGATRASLACDGRERLAWRVEGAKVVEGSPERCTGLRIRGSGFKEFLRAESDPEIAEAAWILQRALFIALGRQHDFDRMLTAEAFAAIVGSACHTFAPGRVANARRMRGSVREFSSAPERVFERS